MPVSLLSRGAAMDGQDRRHVLECRPKVQGGPDGHSHQWLHSVFPATLVLVEQKVKVSLPSASNSLLTDCIARGPRPRYQSSHFHTSCSSAAWLARLACPAAGACWETARGVLTAPTAIQSRAWRCVETATKATEPRLPFPAGQGFSCGQAGVIWRGERPTAR